MVGNTYTYTKADWTTQINAAKAAGIDGFALNMGSDSWQPARVADAYAAAVAAGNFKMFFSFDFSSFACTSTGNAATIGNLIKTYANNGAQAKYANKVLVSSFLGEGCTFGQSNVANGWAYLRKQLSFDIYFMPATFVTPGSASWADGVFNWNSAWPMDGNDISTATDTTYLSALGSKGYMPGISPFFFTYYGPNS
jgi:glucan endo-1,3-alpha-glucosidase